MKFKNNYFTNMYSFEPIDYDLKFMHYYIDMKGTDKSESNLIDEDLLALKDYSRDNCFKLYFKNEK